MPFSDSEIAEYAGLIEQLFWSRRRPPLRLRSKIREGQRIRGNEVELIREPDRVPRSPFCCLRPEI